MTLVSQQCVNFVSTGCKLAKNPQYWEAKELVLFYEREVVVETIANYSSS